MPKGIFEVFTFDSSDQDTCIPNIKSEDHEEEILSLDNDSISKILVTAAVDNCIKVWTYCKVLLYEVTLDDGLRNAVWFRNFELLISHNLKILYFRNIGLKVTAQEIEEANEVAL